MTSLRLGTLALLPAIFASLYLALVGPALHDSKHLRDAFRAIHDDPSPENRDRLVAARARAKREQAMISCTGYLLALGFGGSSGDVFAGLGVFPRPFRARFPRHRQLVMADRYFHLRCSAFSSPRGA